MKSIIALFFLSFINYTFSQELKFENPQIESIILNKYPQIDINKNGKIEKFEAESVKELDLMESNITHANDINLFKNLEYLTLTINKIENLKLKDFKFLKKLYCARNNLKNLEISNMPMLTEFACGINQLTTVKIKNCPNIESLNMMDNKITEIDLKPYRKLKYLSVDNNQLKRLDISNNPELIQLIIRGNELKEIDVRKNTKLKMNILYIDENVKIISTPEQMKMYRTAPAPPPPMG